MFKSNSGGRNFHSLERMKPGDAAHVLGMTQEHMRRLMSKNLLPIGHVVVDDEKQYKKYYIYEEKVAEYMGISRDELEKAIFEAHNNNGEKDENRVAKYMGISRKQLKNVAKEFDMTEEEFVKIFIKAIRA